MHRISQTHIAAINRAPVRNRPDLIAAAGCGSDAKPNSLRPPVLTCSVLHRNAVDGETQRGAFCRVHGYTLPAVCATNMRASPGLCGLAPRIWHLGTEGRRIDHRPERRMDTDRPTIGPAI